VVVEGALVLGLAQLVVIMAVAVGVVLPQAMVVLVLVGRDRLLRPWAWFAKKKAP